MISKYFVAVDGDDVGRRLEYFMLTNDYVSLRNFSSNFAETMLWFRDVLVNNYSADIIFWGGDNLLAQLNTELPIEKSIDILRSDFHRKSSSTLSIGISNTPRLAYLALKIAKASGKNKTYFLQEDDL